MPDTARPAMAADISIFISFLRKLVESVARLAELLGAKYFYLF
jgi:hypothetical protein